MFNLLSILLALIALPIAFVGFLPFLGALNWLAVPIAIVAVVFGLLSSHKSGRNLSLFVLLLACFRLWLGWGVI